MRFRRAAPSETADVHGNAQHPYSGVSTPGIGGSQAAVPSESLPPPSPRDRKETLPPRHNGTVTVELVSVLENGNQAPDGAATRRDIEKFCIRFDD